MEKSMNLRVFLRQILQSTFREELGSILIQPANDLRSSLDPSVDHLCERTASRRLPDVLVVVIVLADHAHLVRNQVVRVECHAERQYDNLRARFRLYFPRLFILVLNPSKTRFLSRGSQSVVTVKDHHA